MRYGLAVLEFFEIVAVLIYSMCAFITIAIAWLNKNNARLIPPCFLFLVVGFFAPVPSWVVVIMPMLAIVTLLSFRKTTKREPFDYQRHLLALRDNGTLTQAQYEEESARIANHG